jgi:type IV pilus assembly protein PilM
MAIPKKNQLVGLDIGSHSIKLVEIDHGKRGRLLRNFGVAPVPPGAIIEGSIKDVEAVSATIKGLFKNLRVRNRNVAISLAGYGVIAKRISLKKMGESEIEKAIQEEAEKYIPYDINEVNLDFAILNPEKEVEESKDQEPESTASNQVDVLLVAAKKDIVEEHVELIRAANLNPGVLDADVFALQNAVEISIDRPEGNYVIITIGAGELGINVVYGGMSTFSRDSSYGGAQITGAIMSEYGVGFDEAEKIKLGGTELEVQKKESLGKIVTNEVSAWVKEIKRALDFVVATYPDEAISEIILAGGSSRIAGLRTYMEQETNIPVVYLNPFRNLIMNSKSFDLEYLDYMAPQAGVAVGLALRSIGDK